MAKDKEILDVPVKFSSITNGEEKVSVPLTLPNTHIKPDHAERFFIGSQLKIWLAADPEATDDCPAQDTLIDGTDTIEAVVNVRSYSRNKNNTKINVSFSKDGCDYHTLIDMSFKHGRIRAERIGDAVKKPRKKKAKAA